MLRQLVELQLEHNAEIKNTIDLAWGVQHNKHKKREAQDLPPDPSDPKSKQKLQLNPIGQDTQRKRYWVVDGPCIFFQYSNPSICAYLGGDAPPIFIIFVELSASAARSLSNSCVHLSYLFRFTANIYFNESMENGGYFPDYFVYKGGICCHHREHQSCRSYRTQSERKAVESRTKSSRPRKSPRRSYRSRRQRN